MTEKTPLVIALLGAESTGKTQLTLRLAAYWQAQGLAVISVPEVLREWCDHAGRTPQPHEQAGIAKEQAHRTQTALMTPGVNMVIADTTPLMTAIYSDKLFQDPSLYAFALTHHGIYTHTLLTGVDLPWVADGIQRDNPSVQAPVDTMIRSALGGAGITFQVVYGQGEARLHNALRAVAPEETIHLTALHGGAAQISGTTVAKSTNKLVPPNTQNTWTWECDKCSDPDCENRLFTGLLR